MLLFNWIEITIMFLDINFNTSNVTIQLTATGVFLVVNNNFNTSNVTIQR